VLALLAASSLFLVTPEISRLRHAAGDALSHLPPSDPTRRRFGMLHGVSTVLFGLQAVLAVALVALRRPGPVKGRSGR
jgi:hypothetical protein